MTKRESSLLWSLERGLGIALQAVLEKKAVMSRKRGRLVGFSICGASVGFLTRYDGELREPLVWRQGSQGFMSVAEGVHHCPRVMVEESSLKALRIRTLEVFLGVWQETLGSLDLCP